MFRSKRSDGTQNGLHPVIQARGLTKDLPLGSTVVHALRGVDLEIAAGEIVSIVGPSGSGKSTLLGLIGGLDSPTRGTIAIDGVEISRMNEDQLTEIRNEKIGFIFQFFNLIPSLTAQENVMLPIQFARRPQFSPAKRARELLEMLGLKDRLGHRPAELSGGQQQRVAIARALANNPPLLLADEPTGNLDQESGALVLETLQRIREQNRTTVVLVTHDPELARRADRVITLVDGQIASPQVAADFANPHVAVSSPAPVRATTDDPFGNDPDDAFADPFTDPFAPLDANRR